jgi:hypothetical protein
MTVRKFTLFYIAVLLCSCWWATAYAADFNVYWADSDHKVADFLISGPITRDDYYRFAAHARELAGASKVYVRLSSSGGEVNDAMTIGASIKSRGWNTVVLTTCTSACALIWLAGKQRFLAAVARVGFHRATTEDGGKLPDHLRPDNPDADANVMAYLKRLELPEAVILFATEAPPTSMNWLTEHNLKTLPLDVVRIRGVPPDTFAPW